jgi:N-formylglutamate deformylase
VVVEVPHAGLFVDPPSAWGLAAPARSIAQDADLYVDELYAHAPDHGATLIFSHISRYVCDLNRAEGDIDHIAVDGAPLGRAPHGLIWRSTTEGQPALYSPLARAELDRRLDAFYRPYHQAIAEALARKRTQFGFAILLCAHSMPSTGRSNASAPATPRADVVPGSRGGSTSGRPVLDVVERSAREFGLSIRHDDPYRGGHSTAHYGEPHRGTYAVQVELARRLYMDERGLTKKPSDFHSCQRFCDTLVAGLGKLRLA